MATVNVIFCFLWSRAHTAWLHQPFSFTTVLHYAWAPQWNFTSLNEFISNQPPPPALHLVPLYGFSNRFTCLRVRNRENYVLLLLRQPFVPQAVSRRPRMSEDRVRRWTRPFGIWEGHSGTATGFSSSTSVFPCQYHSTIAPYSFIHLPPTLYNGFLPALQFSPVSITPPLLHTHSSIYHPRCIIFFSQYFSFPLSVSFHHCSILIHPSTTHAL